MMLSTLHLEIELVQILQGFLFGFAERVLDHLAGGIGVQSPELTEVLGDMPFLAGAEWSERPPQEHKCPPELVLVQRFNVAGELLPQRLPGEQGVAVALC